MQRLPENAGVNKLKRKRRDLERVLKKPGLSAEKKQTTERALAVLAADLQNAEKRNQTKKVAQKYHMVRFFERKKAVRALRKPNADDQALADYYYVTLAPKEVKYMALFADGAVGRESPNYKKILQDMKSGTLKAGKEGKQAALEAEKPKPKDNKRKAAGEPKQRKKPKPKADSDSDSDASESEAQDFEEQESK